MKYKILYVNLFPEIGGAETSLIYLLEGLNRKKFTPYVIVPKSGQFSERLKKLCKLIYLDLPGYTIRELFIPGTNLIALFKFGRICKITKPDLIHLNHITQSFYAGCMRILFKIPVIATSWVNSDCVYFYQNIISNFGCNLILPITPELKIQILNKKFIPRNKLLTIFPGVDNNFFTPSKSKVLYKKSLGLNSQYLTLSIISRFDFSKDHLTFLKAVNLVIKKYPKINIVIAQSIDTNLEIGNHMAPIVKKQIDKFLSKNPLLQKRVTFTGYQNDMRFLYNATDILVNSSLYESLGISLIEAASCSIPIVATNGGTQHHVVMDNVNGFLVGVGDYHKMADQILKLCQNPKLRYLFGKQARLITLTKFSLKRYAEEITQVYEHLLK